jgi:hypothetical protein
LRDVGELRHGDFVCRGRGAYTRRQKYRREPSRAGSAARFCTTPKMPGAGAATSCFGLCARGFVWHIQIGCSFYQQSARQAT